MKRFTLFLTLTLALLLTGCSSFLPGHPEQITVAELQDHISFLASDEMAGRKPGTAGCDSSAAYIARHFAAAGLTPMGDKGFQYFDVVTSVELGPHNELVFGGIKGIPGEDYTPLPYSENAVLEAPLVFAGYGIQVEQDSLSWLDYANVDVTGRWVVILRGNPDVDKDQSPFDPYSALRKKVLTARDQGAAGVVFLSGPQFDPDDNLLSLSYDMSQTRSGLPVLHLTRAFADRLLEGSQTTVSDLENSVIDPYAPASRELTGTLTVHTEIVQQHVRTQNVVGYLEGSDPALKDEVIVLGAHYDHLGMGGPGSGSRKPDTLAIHNGADDNASGTAGIIELAEQFARGPRPRHSLLFMAFGAEEMGLLGSKFFTANALFDLEKIDLMINLDMVGRLNPDTKKLTVGGTGTAAELTPLLQELGVGRTFELGLSPEGYGPSDHASFYIEDIPVLFFFTGVHSDYHTPADDIEKINFRGEKDVLEFVESVLRSVDGLQERLTFQTAGPKERGERSRRFKVTLGIVPDYASTEKNGLRIDGVVEGKPADRAGMQQGDVIVAMEGKPVGDIYDYMYRLAEFKPGQRISVDVRRGEQLVVLIVEL